MQLVCIKGSILTYHTVSGSRNVSTVDGGHLMSVIQSLRLQPFTLGCVTSLQSHCKWFPATVVYGGRKHCFSSAVISVTTKKTFDTLCDMFVRMMCVK